ncbi:hypothetical protein VNO78_11951 [Psophocarpus tetragonolobus]|uniref:Uncharacterized protein n=1 Tax=Psophocarpus tetragonolobus TaxID=3891 RepID=A0AAN9XP20_PSOTE
MKSLRESEAGYGRVEKCNIYFMNEKKEVYVIELDYGTERESWILAPYAVAGMKCVGVSVRRRELRASSVRICVLSVKKTLFLLLENVGNHV